MENGTRINNDEDESKRIAQEAFDNRIKERDRLYPDPSVRAIVIFEYLKSSKPEFTNWDTLCFAIEMLAMTLPASPWLDPEIRNLVRKLYTVHYSMDVEGLKTEIKK